MSSLVKIFFILLLAVLFNNSAFATFELVDKIVAVVNTEVVSESDIKAFSQKITQNGMIDELLLFGKSSDSLKNNRDELLNYLINEKLIESEIKRLNLSVTVERVEQEIREVAKRNGVGRAELMTAIKAQGVSASYYQDFIKKRIERQSLIEQEVSSRIRVSDEDVLAQYVRNKPDGNTGSFEYTISHIFFNPKKGGAEAAFDRAQTALKKIQGGQSFESVAEQFSEDPNFSTGGTLGSFTVDELSEGFEQALRNLEVGATTANIVKTKNGFHILKLNSKKVTTDPQYEKEKEKIRAELFEKSFQKNFKVWLESKKEESFVRINK